MTYRRRKGALAAMRESWIEIWKAACGRLFCRLHWRGVIHASHSPSVRRIRRATGVFNALV